jgi:hypothetical protein
VLVNSKVGLAGAPASGDGGFWEFTDGDGRDADALRVCAEARGVCAKPKLARSTMAKQSMYQTQAVLGISFMMVLLVEIFHEHRGDKDGAIPRSSKQHNSCKWNKSIRTRGVNLSEADAEYKHFLPRQARRTWPAADDQWHSGSTSVARLRSLEKVLACARF